MICVDSVPVVVPVVCRDAKPSDLVQPADVAKAVVVACTPRASCFLEISVQPQRELFRQDLLMEVRIWRGRALCVGGWVVDSMCWVGRCTMVRVLLPFPPRAPCSLTAPPPSPAPPVCIPAFSP